MSRGWVWREQPVLVAALAALFVAAVGATVTDLGPWYQSLKEPAWKPPDLAFGPIWTTIFALAAIAGVKGWRAEPNAARRGAFAALGENRKGRNSPERQRRTNDRCAPAKLQAISAHP